VRWISGLAWSMPGWNSKGAPAWAAAVWIPARGGMGASSLPSAASWSGVPLNHTPYLPPPASSDPIAPGPPRRPRRCRSSPGPRATGPPAACVAPPPGARGPLADTGAASWGWRAPVVPVDHGRMGRGGDLRRCADGTVGMPTPQTHRGVSPATSAPDSDGGRRGFHWEARPRSLREGGPRGRPPGGG